MVGYMRAVVYGAVVVCLIVLWNIYHPAKIVIDRLEAAWPKVLWQVTFDPDDGWPSSTTTTAGWPPKMMALTIDDSPSEYTADILDVLERYGAKATFFVIGKQVAGREDSLVDLVVRGHELGNHGMRDEPALLLNTTELSGQIDEVDDMISNIYSRVRQSTVRPAGVEIGDPPRYFRPGSGVFSNAMVDMIDRSGRKLVLGSIYPHDPQIKYWTVNAGHVLSSARPGAIVICHDRRSWTVPMLEYVLDRLSRQGYQIVTVSRLVAAGSGGSGRERVSQVESQ